jgi:parvulin-like peptidyl-prolyl isomerase
MLEGFALFRLDERVAPKLHDFSEVKPRAQELLKREQQEQAWKGLASRLRKAANIQILAPITGNDNKQP